MNITLSSVVVYEQYAVNRHCEDFGVVDTTVPSVCLHVRVRVLLHEHVG